MTKNTVQQLVRLSRWKGGGRERIRGCIIIAGLTRERGKMYFTCCVVYHFAGRALGDPDDVYLQFIVFLFNMKCMNRNPRKYNQ